MPTTVDMRATYRATLAFLTGREELPIVLNERGLLGCGVEIGVQEGLFSEHLLENWRGMHLISVDPWWDESGDRNVETMNVSQAEHDELHRRTTARLARFGRRSSIWRATSVEASRFIPDHCLDFVYIDARYGFGSIAEDLAAWFRKVRPGGIIAGHDYIDGEGDAGSFLVKVAVDRFFGDLGLTVHATLEDAPFRSWLVEVPAPAYDGASAAAEAPTSEALTSEAVTPEPRNVIPIVSVRSDTRRSVSLRLDLPSGPRQVRLRLDESLESQRMMLRCFDEKRLYEENTSQFMASVLRPGDSFIDIGTHVGYFSMLAASIVGPEGTIISFEPELRNYNQLLEHIELNGFGNVAAINAAVGAATGMVEFHINADDDGGHALWDLGLHPHDQKSRSTPRTRTVNLVSLDNFLIGLDVSPRVIKIDVAGAEHSVLLGAREILSTRPIPFVVAEINRFGLERMGTTEQAVRRYMTELGFETYTFDPQGGRIVRLEETDRVETDFAFNLIFRHSVAAAAA